MYSHPPGIFLSLRNRLILLVIFALGILGLLSATVRVAHSRPRPAAVQILTGYLDPGEREVYHLANLRRGDTLYVYLERLSGNLDPLFAVADGHFQLKRFDDQLQAKLRETPHSPYNVFRNLLNSFYLAWDDDGGRGSDAALKFPIPADGDYKVVVAGSRQPVGHKVTGETFGG
jgi:hypothetical protein